MPVLLAFAILFFAQLSPAGAESVSVSISIRSGDAESFPTELIRAGFVSLFSRQYGRLVELSFAAPPASETTARISLDLRDSEVDIGTEMSRGSIVRALQSTVPRGSLNSMASTIAGDLAFLWCSFGGFSGLPLSQPPALIAALDIDTLSTLTGWEREELEPMDLAGSGDEVTICFARRYLSLGPLFRLSAATVRDIQAQSFGREPLQLSGIAMGRGDEIFLLSERAAKIARVDPRLGTRVAGDAPGLSGRGAASLDRDSVAVLDASGSAANLRIYTLPAAEPAASRTIRLSASYVSAFGMDVESNLWAWDARERRVRIFTPDGREAYSIRPLFKASIMPLPQQLAIFADGSFLLGGSGEVWKFENSGIPVWRLARVPGRTGERLPASFAIAADSARKTFTLLDAQSRRVLQFSEDPAWGGELGELLSRLDGRKAADLEKAARLAGESGLTLMAVQFAGLLERRGGTGELRASAELALLREKTRLSAELADSLMRDLLYDQSERAFLRASESARELAAREPDDPETARLLEALVSRRREIRDSLAQKPEVTISSSSARPVSAETAEDAGSPAPCGEALTVTLGIRNTGPLPISAVRVRVALPGISAIPALAEIESLPKDADRQVEMRLALSEPMRWRSAAPQMLSAAALIAYERGVVGRTVPLSASIPLAPPADEAAAAGALAHSLACLADPRDALLDRLLEKAKEGSDPLAAAAGVLDFLGEMRRFSASTAPLSVPPRSAVLGPLGLRAALRGLSSGELDWTLLTLSIASSLGIPAGVIAWPEKAFVLLETDIPLPDALSGIPGLERYETSLRKLSRKGLLCIPLSGRVQPTNTSESCSAWSLMDALQACAESGMEGAVIAWPERYTRAAGARPGAPVPFPFAFATFPARPTRDTLRSEIIRLLEREP